MTRKQLIAILSLPALVLTMVPVYRFLARMFGHKQAWYYGFLVYWPLWCLLLPLKLLGLDGLASLFRSRRPDKLGWFMLVFPPFMAFVGRFVLDKQPRSTKEKITLVGMAFMNGTLEEVLWRGVYTALFPTSLLWGIAWPTLWFALWHYAPGSISPLTDVQTLMIGAGVYGLFLGKLAQDTRSIRWAAASHTLAGLVQGLV